MKVLNSCLFLCFVVFGTTVITGCGTPSAESSQTAEGQVSETTEEQWSLSEPTPFTPKFSEDGASQMVSLSLPNMCCDGCVSSVKEALASIEGISGFEADASAHSASFQANSSVNVGELLDNLSETNSHIRGWSQESEIDDADQTSTGVSVSEESST